MYIKILGSQTDVAKHPGKLASCYIEYVGQKILIDCGPDLQSQLNEKQIQSLSCLLITHGHPDSVSGISLFNSDLRNADKTIKVFVEKKTWEFITNKYEAKNVSQFLPEFLELRKSYRLEGGLEIRPLRVAHSSEIFPTVAFNLDGVFVYCPDGYLGGSGIDEYEMKYWKDNILAVLDGAYWDKQVGKNHTAVIPNLDTYMFLGNQNTLLIGCGNQWPELSEARDTLVELKSKWQDGHDDFRVKDFRPVREGEQFNINMNKLLENTDVTKPAFTDILANPKILTEISDKELLMTHFRCHQQWGNSNSNKEMVQKVHTLVVREMLKRGMKVQRIDAMDDHSFQALGHEAKVFEMYLNMPDEYLIAGDVIKLVGSSLYKTDPTDIDIVAPEYAYDLVTKLFNKYRTHLIGNVESHGDVVNMYDLILRKKDLQVGNAVLPDFTRTPEVAPTITKLQMKGVDTYIVEPVIEGKTEIVLDKEQRIIYEHVITDDGADIITDLLAYKKDNFEKEILVNRMYFMQKKWLDTLDKGVLLPYRWVVKKEALFDFLASLDLEKVIVRPANSYYSEGKCIIDLTSVPVLNAGPDLGSVPDPIPGGFLPKPTSVKPRRRRKKPTVKDVMIEESHSDTMKPFLETYLEEVKAKPVEPKWTIKPGDKFQYCIQVHLRGLEKYQLDPQGIKKFGDDPTYFIPSAEEYGVLKSIVDADWHHAITEAQVKDSSELQHICSHIDSSKLSESELKILSKVSPVSLHQDIRIVVEGNDYFEGGHWTTPGNQFKENRLLELDSGVYAQFQIKSPHVDELTADMNAEYIRTGVVEPVIQGPKSWLEVGAPHPLIIQPGGVGGTSEKWAAYNRIEFATGQAGRQTSASGSNHFRLFHFTGKILNGYIVFMYAPLAQGKRIWVTMKPKDQAKYAQEFDKPESKYLSEVQEKWFEVLYQTMFK